MRKVISRVCSSCSSILRSYAVWSVFCSLNQVPFQGFSYLFVLYLITICSLQFGIRLFSYCEIFLAIHTKYRYITNRNKRIMRKVFSRWCRSRSSILTSYAVWSVFCSLNRVPFQGFIYLWVIYLIIICSLQFEIRFFSYCEIFLPIHTKYRYITNWDKRIMSKVFSKWCRACSSILTSYAVWSLFCSLIRFPFEDVDYYV